MKLMIEIPEEDYIRLRDEGMFDNVTTFKRAVREGIPLEQEPCEDAISRQAVINAIANTCFWLSADNWEELIKCINSISPVTPAEKVGRWVYNKNLSTCYSDVYTCSECGERCLESCYERIEKLPDFCPKCHIKMEVEE